MASGFGRASNPGLASQLPTRRSARLQTMGAEVAPNVVDATAVVLPSSPHATVVDGLENDLPVGEAVPVFDPMESDEEDEFDAISGNVTDNEPLVRPFNGNVTQRRSIEDVPCRRPRVIGVSQGEASQASLPASAVVASSTAVRQACEHPSRVDNDDEQPLIPLTRTRASPALVRTS